MDKLKQIQETKSEPQTEILPEDVMVEYIMPRLPAKPLMRFKCVSKSWQSTISTPQFAKSHFKSHSPPSPQFLLFSGNPQHPFTVVTFDKHGRVSESTPLDFTLNGGVPFHVAGTSNGLVCLFDKHFNFRICNPVTRQCNDIPPISLPRFKPITVIAVGFGYLASVDDYKIACLHGLSDNYLLAEDIDVFGVYIFSSKTQKWQELSCFGTQVEGVAIARADASVLIDDTMYWYAANVNVVFGVNLVSGEFSTIPFSLLELMDSLRPYERIKLFGSSDGRLALFCAKQAWVLNEDGVTWTKLYDLNCDRMRLLCFSGTTGKWVVRNRGLVAVLDPSKRFNRQYQVGTKLNDPVFSAFEFKMSLLPPSLE